MPACCSINAPRHVGLLNAQLHGCIIDGRRRQELDRGSSQVRLLHGSSLAGIAPAVCGFLALIGARPVIGVRERHVGKSGQIHHSYLFAKQFNRDQRVHDC